MTGRARELWRGLRRIGPAGISSLWDRSAIRFAVTVPQGVPAEAIAHLERMLGRLLGERVDDLGIDRDVILQVEQATNGVAHIEASVGGRPVAMLAPPPGGDGATAPDWAAEVVGLIDHSLRRRLSLLLSEADQERCTDLITSAAGLGADQGRCAAVPGYLLDQGLSLRTLDTVRLGPEDLDGREGDLEIGEVLINAIEPRPVSIEIDQGTLRRSSDESRTDLTRARQELYATLGIAFPDVQIALAEGPGPFVRFTFQNVRLPELRLPAGADWHDVVIALHRELAAQAHWFLRASDVGRDRRSLESPIPSLVRLSRMFFGDALLTGCLRSLVRNGDSVRNIPRMLWLLLESNPGRAGADTVRFAEAPVATSSSRVDVPRDPDVLASGLRKRIAAECWRVGAPDDSELPVRLPERLEAALIDLADESGLAAAEWETVHLVAEFGRRGTPFQVVTGSLDALRPVRDALAALNRPPRVVAASEFPPDVRLDSTW